MPGVLIEQRVQAALDARLTADVDRPVALALSGGGDSVALLHMAADWARRRGRRLLALTVDHGLHPDSQDWTTFAGEAARALGAEWRALAWRGEKPSSGLPAAARAARHALIAGAARKEGARVVLFAHTADDVEESGWMRARGATLGVMRDWSPSPAWPEGRGVMLLRPLLGERRTALRAFLSERGATWLEDPANADMRFGRSRARAMLADGAERTPQAAPDATSATGFDMAQGWAGVARAPRSLSGRELASVLACVSGGMARARGERLQALHARIRGDEDFTATLCGARLDASGAALTFTREPGRTGLASVDLPPGEAVIWDGRFEITADGPGWRVGPSAGRMARLEPDDRRVTGALPAAARGALPVLFRDEGSRPVLAWRAARTRCLVAGRLLAAAGGIGHEDHIDRACGETPPEDLFSV